jgi:hypothetical protein
MCNKSNAITCLKRTTRILYILQKNSLLQELEPVLNETTPSIETQIQFWKEADCLVMFHFLDDFNKLKTSNLKTLKPNLEPGLELT